MRQLTLVLVLVLASGVASADPFEGVFRQADGSEVTVRRKPSGEGYLLTKRSTVEGRERIQRGEGQLSNGVLRGRFSTGVKRGVSFLNNLKNLKDGQVKEDIALESFELTALQARQQKLSELPETVKERELDKRVQALEAEDQRRAKIQALEDELKAAQRLPQKPASTPKASVSAKPAQAPKAPTPLDQIPAMALFSLLLGLAAARRRLRQIRNNPFSPERLKIFRRAFNTLIDDVSFVDRKLPNFKASATVQRPISEGAKALQQLFRGTDFQSLANRSRRLINLTMKSSFNRPAIDLTRSFERLEQLKGRARQAIKRVRAAEAGLTKFGLDAINRPVVKPSRLQEYRRLKAIKDGAQLEFEREVEEIQSEFEKARRQVEVIRQADILNRATNQRSLQFDGQKILTSGREFQDDPRNRVIDLFDPTENFAKGGVFNQALGFAKLVTYGVLDAQYGTLSRTDRNIQAFNKGEISYAEARWRNDMGALSDTLRVAASFALNKAANHAKAEDPNLSKAQIGALNSALQFSQIGYNLTVAALTKNAAGQRLTGRDIAAEFADKALGPAIGAGLGKAGKVGKGIDKIFEPFVENPVHPLIIDPFLDRTLGAEKAEPSHLKAQTLKPAVRP